MRVLLVLCMIVIASAAIAHSDRQRPYSYERDKSKPSYRSCMVRLHSYGFSPRAALNRCRLFSPGGFSR
jgi:hypothetical protein